MYICEHKYIFTFRHQCTKIIFSEFYDIFIIVITKIKGLTLNLKIKYYLLVGYNIRGDHS